jgi:hypothetical protein
MNLQLANVISDLSGKTGLQILRAVLNGERDPAKLADFRDPRIKASREDIIVSLRGNWRAELLFQVKQELARYDFCQMQIAECDRELEQQLQSLPELRAGEEKSGTKETQQLPKKRKRRKGGPTEKLAQSGLNTQAGREQIVPFGSSQKMCSP